MKRNEENGRERRPTRRNIGAIRADVRVRRGWLVESVLDKWMTRRHKKCAIVDLRQGSSKIWSSRNDRQWDINKTLYFIYAWFNGKNIVGVLVYCFEETSRIFDSRIDPRLRSLQQKSARVKYRNCNEM